MSKKDVLGLLILLQNIGFVFVIDDRSSVGESNYRLRSPFVVQQRRSDFESNSDRNPRGSFGLYNVQTGDEFYMNDFVMRPKVKTKYNNNAQKIDFEYSPTGFVSNNNTEPPTTTTHNCPKPPQNTKKQTSSNKKKQVRQPNNKNKKQPAQAIAVNKGQTRRRCVRKKPNGVKVIVACSNQPNKIVRNSANKNRNTTCNKTAKGKLNCSPSKNRVVTTKSPKLQKVQKGKQSNKKNINKLAPSQGSSKTVQNYAKFQAEPERNKGKIEIVGDVIKKYLTRLKQKFYGIRGGKKVSDEAVMRSILNARDDLENRTIKLSNNLLSLFTVVQVHNFKCVATSESGNYVGKCQYASQCKKLGGTALGDCVNGFGVCCVFINTCAGVSGQNCSYFQSPGYASYFPNENTPPVGEDSTSTTIDVTTIDPRLGTTEQDSGEMTTEEFTEEPGEDSTDYFITQTTTESFVPDPRNKYKEYQLSRDGDVADALSCTYRVYKLSNDVQQMRIDFIDLELAGPTDGECVEEKLVITGQNLNTAIPPLCGYNSGQHVYLDVSSLSGPLQLSVLANSASSKRYKIRICQFSSPCSNSLSCLQYYTGVQGVVSSFNYDRATTFSRSNPEYLNNLNYAICIRREAGYCSITYDNIDSRDQEYPFELLNIDVDDRITVADGQSGMGLDECPDDYVVINNIRFCGEDFSGPITDASAGPIVIPVRSNSEITGRGFKLYYTQNKCPT